MFKASLFPEGENGVEFAKKTQADFIDKVMVAQTQKKS
jgi:hypothetical protein